jgi:hypothetical protein
MRLRSLLALVVLARPLAAQVGHPPAQSPYRDVLARHALTLNVGTYIGADDPAGVHPKSGPLLGVRYDAFIGGPAQLVLRVQMAPTARNEIDPLRPAATRLLGERSSLLTLADIGINVNLTGNKSWNGVIPTLLTTVGIMSDFAAEDAGGYAFGTNFAFGIGGGVRYIPRDARWEIRGDVHNILSQSGYPTAYFRISDDGSAAVPPNTPRSAWRRHTTIALGLTYHLFR